MISSTPNCWMIWKNVSPTSYAKLPTVRVVAPTGPGEIENRAVKRSTMAAKLIFGNMNKDKNTAVKQAPWIVLIGTPFSISGPIKGL